MVHSEHNHHNEYGCPGNKAESVTDFLRLFPGIMHPFHL